MKLYNQSESRFWSLTRISTTMQKKLKGHTYTFAAIVVGRENLSWKFILNTIWTYDGQLQTLITQKTY